jgi:hypothetical protein
MPESMLSPSQGLWIWPLALLAGVHTDIWLEREDLGMSQLRHLIKMLSKETKMLYLCYGISVLFNNVLEALNF